MTDYALEHRFTGTLFARWLQVYTLTLDDQGADGTSGNPATFYENYYGSNGFYTNSSCTTPLASVTTPTRTGYDFGGYYKTINSVKTYIINSSGNFTGTYLAENATLLAQWNPHTYIIAYTLAGGTSGSSAPTSGNQYGDSIHISNPTRTGYDFAGWTASNSLNTTTAYHGTEGARGSGHSVQQDS